MEINGDILSVNYGWREEYVPPVITMFGCNLGYITEIQKRVLI